MGLSVKIFRLGNGYAMYVTPFIPPEILLKKPRDIVGEVIGFDNQDNIIILKIKLHTPEEDDGDG